MNEKIVPDIWTKESYKEFIDKFVLLSDIKYLEFNKKITFTKYEMIGIRVPTIREIAKDIKKTDIYSFLELCERKYFEEILLEGIVISFIREYQTFLKYLRKFLPYIDNWAICDLCISSMKIIEKNQDEFESFVKELLNSREEYYVRVGVVALMNYYLIESKLDKVFSYIDNIKRDEYYIEMAIAWLLSISFIKYPTATEKYLSNNNLSDDILNKTIQKIRDSKQVDLMIKDEVLKYKRK